MSDDSTPPASANVASPCPFCGDTPVVHPGRSFPDMIYVSCHQNHCHVNPETWAYTTNEAIARWNKRFLILPDDIRADIMSLVSCVSIVHHRKNIDYADHETMLKAERVEKWLKTLKGGTDE